MAWRIVIIDDHKVVREGLRKILEQESDFEIVGEAGSGKQASWLIAHKKPDVALLDIRLDEVSGLDVCRYAASVSPKTRVLFLTAFMDSNLIHQALQAGAKGYLLKDAEQMDLVARIRQVLAGQMAFDPRVTHSLAEYAVEHPPDETDALLSVREVEVLRLMAQGMTNSEIADTLFISAATVKDHVRHIMTKLDARNRVDAVTRAVRRGLI